MKADRYSVRIRQGNTRPAAGDEISFDVPIKFVRKGGNARKLPKPGSPGGPGRAQPGDSAL